ncbi:Alcohol dehydrogenase, class IV [Pilibacter termitis]|uniref:Alcohol dehydrogenase, class IV n=1 Tax=Pilibacter termitis TaxID=263852 RepID=A0A1T4K6P6_9ENTE|nr:1-propanol dehydrogenase PduQ [Pilibacter termitis]SJZ38091.1 Alcohol dehydrogenase, class IV [Pilibacter termitis]
METLEMKTKIINGSISCLSELPEEKIFVVSDPFLLETPIFSQLQAALASKQVKIFSNIQPDPPIEQVMEGIEEMKAFAPEAIVAIGGGSAIDAAKGMKFFYNKLEENAKIFFVAIPTTSGTGSEVTSFAVITNKDTGTKYPLVTDEILPELAILDVELVKTVPPKITADTGMDVLTHVLEAYVSTGHNDFSDAYAEKVVQLVFEYLPRAYKNGEDTEAREKMHIASTLAGIAFNQAGLGLNHGIAHAAGARFHVPHGRMNAILMPEIVAFNAELEQNVNNECITAARYANLARLIGCSSASSRAGVNYFIRAIKKLRATLDMPSTLQEWGLKKQDVLKEIQIVAENALKDPTTATNPRKPSEDDVVKILEKVL